MRNFFLLNISYKCNKKGETSLTKILYCNRAHPDISFKYLSRKTKLRPKHWKQFCCIFVKLEFCTWLLSLNIITTCTQGSNWSSKFNRSSKEREREYLVMLVPHPPPPSFLTLKKVPHFWKNELGWGWDNKHTHTYALSYTHTHKDSLSVSQKHTHTHARSHTRTYRRGCDNKRLYT